MSFRARLALVAAAAVALAIVAASFVVYFIVKDQLRSPIDDSLRQSADQIQHSPPDDAARAFYHLRSDLGGAPGYPQGVTPAGTRLLPQGATVPLPIDADDRAVAQGKARAKAHPSRRAYPTPRTVWIRRGLPPASVLRRR